MAIPHGGFYTAIVELVIPPDAGDKPGPHQQLQEAVIRRINGKAIARCARSDGASFDLISFVPQRKENSFVRDAAMHAVYYGLGGAKAKILEAPVWRVVTAPSSLLSKPARLPVVSFAVLLRELQCGTAVDECGDAAAAKAISQHLLKLVFVPPVVKGGLAIHR